ncbi:Fur family transcriptional regulator [Furfurilactobacillus sp. WILCCON 0119]|uniref:Fur family transcriptional regulator n=1 Tax=Furfurilactobacillus entadae TaxID=2922307 RepID=UPI0035E96D86
MDTDEQRAVAVLQQNHLKVTKQRRTLLSCLCKQPDHYTDVTRLDAYMRDYYPGMSHATIYRNIKEFADIGLVEQQMDGDQARVKFQCDFSNLHHHHFICRNCGKVTEVKMCPESFFEEQLPGAKIEGHRFEMYGLCADCVAAEA